MRIRKLSSNKEFLQEGSKTYIEALKNGSFKEEFIYLEQKKIKPNNNNNNNDNQQKKRTCKIVDFAVPADHRIKLKEYEKKD